MGFMHEQHEEYDFRQADSTIIGNVKEGNRVTSPSMLIPTIRFEGTVTQVQPGGHDNE